MTEERLPAEIRVAPATEPTFEVDAQAHVPPEAAVVAVAHGDASGAPLAASGGSAEALAAAEGADPSPAEMRVPPTPEPTVDLGEGAHIPPEAGVVPAPHRDGADPSS